MRSWWVRIASHYRRRAAGLAMIMALMLVGVGLDLLRPWPIKFIVDHGLSSQPLPTQAQWLRALPGADGPRGLIGWLAGGMVLLAISTKIIATAQSYVRAGTGNRMVFDLGATLYEHLQRLSTRFHGKHRVGDLVKRVTTDSGVARDLAFNVMLPLVTSLVTLPAMFIVLWQLDSLLATVAVLVAPVMGIVIKVLAEPMSRRTYEQQVREGELISHAEQTLVALPMIQAFGREPQEDQRFRSYSQQTLKAYLRMMATQLQFKVGIGAITAIGTASILVLGGWHVLDGRLTIGSLLVFISYLASLYAPIETLAYLSSGFASASAGARRVLELIDEEDFIHDTLEAKPISTVIGNVAGRLCIEHVTFGYDAKQPTLHDVSLEISAGEKVAIIGPTGAGKTTLAALLPRFIDPWQGRVTLDGIDIRQIKLQELRQQFALVLQEPFILPIRVADVIAYGRPGASPEEIQAAARAANAHEFITRLPNGYDTKLGERGATLSGGERQRLAIARAILKDAPVLILDEATSALDAATEHHVMEALDRLMHGRTTVIIAHRPTTIARADRIVLMDQGRIVEAGTFKQLLALQMQHPLLREVLSQVYPSATVDPAFRK